MGNQILTQPTAARDEFATIFVAIELSLKSWLVALRGPLSEKVSLHKLASGDVPGLLGLIARYQARVERSLGEPVSVVSCYEAGYEGFWLDRRLKAAGIENRVIDPSSILVNRRARRAKTDRIDVQALLRALMAWLRGDRDVCHMVRVPSPEQEDAKRLHRERQRLIKERTSHTNRIKALLVCQGIYRAQPRRRGFAARLAQLVTGDGRPLEPRLLGEIERELERLALVQDQIAALEAERDRALKAAVPAGTTAAKKQQLTKLKAIGPEMSTVLVGEVFYRDFENRRQLGSYVGLTGCPFNSGRMRREQGLNKAGNPRARTAMIELSWMWLQHQPDSALSRWFDERVNGAKGRLKKIMIVALARKLLIALWRYLETGLVPEGARFTA